VPAQILEDRSLRPPLPLLLPLLLALLLPACAALPFAPMAVEAVRESAIQEQRFEGGDFAAAAREACRASAARHGRVEITAVEPHGGEDMRVYGTIDRFGGSPGRSFACVFRRDGNLPYFKLGARSLPSGKN
jgi:hypothetical protein